MTRAGTRIGTAVLAVSLVLVAGCGEADGDLEIGLDIRLSTLTGDEVLQFVVLRDRDVNGDEVICQDFQDACVAERRPRPRPLTLETPSGSQCSYRTPLDLAAAASDDGQPVSIPGIPPGRNYLVVVEIVRDGAGGEQRVGVGCMPVEQIVRGTNRPPTTPIDVLDSGGGCLPALDSC